VTEESTIQLTLNHEQADLILRGLERFSMIAAVAVRLSDRDALRDGELEEVEKDARTAKALWDAIFDTGLAAGFGKP